MRLQAPRDHALAEDNGTRRFTTRPDIVISRNAEHLLIVDTKWTRLNGPIAAPRQPAAPAQLALSNNK